MRGRVGGSSGGVVFVCVWVGVFSGGIFGSKKILLPWWGHRVGPGNEWGGACGGQGKKEKEMCRLVSV